MALNAHVRCNCFTEGRTKPFPFPDRLKFDEAGEPEVDNSDDKLTLDDLIEFDQWNYDWGCEHHGYLFHTRIGTIASVALVRALVEAHQNSRTPFSLLSSKVVYDGIHCGDYIQSGDAVALLQEIKDLEFFADDEIVKAFCEKMRTLCEASITSRNPIVF